MINIIFFSFIKTGKHSSRTAYRLLQWPSGEGGGVCLLGGSAPVHAGIPARGMSAQCMLGYLPGGMSAPVHAGIHPPCGQNS